MFLNAFANRLHRGLQQIQALFFFFYVLCNGVNELNLVAILIIAVDDLQKSPLVFAGSPIFQYADIIN
jgi:hypothetical protein